MVYNLKLFALCVAMYTNASLLCSAHEAGPREEMVYNLKLVVLLWQSTNASLLCSADNAGQRKEI